MHNNVFLSGPQIAAITKLAAAHSNAPGGLSLTPLGHPASHLSYKPVRVIIDGTTYRIATDGGIA